MPLLAESLEKRIQELKASIETQQMELADYERVLALERGTTRSVSGQTATEGTDTALPTTPSARTSSPAGSGPAFHGNKTEFVAALVQAQGNAGTTPKEIEEAFAQRGIEKGKNLIYSALSFLVKQRKLKKQGDRYVAVTTPSRPPPRSSAAQQPSHSKAKQKRAVPQKTTAGVRTKSAPPSSARSGAQKTRAKKAATKAAG